MAAKDASVAIRNTDMQVRAARTQRTSEGEDLEWAFQSLGFGRRGVSDMRHSKAADARQHECRGESSRLRRYSECLAQILATSDPKRESQQFGFQGLGLWYQNELLRNSKNRALNAILGSCHQPMLADHPKGNETGRNGRHASCRPTAAPLRCGKRALNLGEAAIV